MPRKDREKDEREMRVSASNDRDREKRERDAGDGAKSNRQSTERPRRDRQITKSYVILVSYQASECIGAACADPSFWGGERAPMQVIRE